jgi:hypothetical protein
MNPPSLYNEYILIKNFIIKKKLLNPVFQSKPVSDPGSKKKDPPISAMTYGNNSPTSSPRRHLVFNLITVS